MNERKGVWLPSPLPELPARERRRNRKKREQGRNKQDEEVTKAQQKEDPPPLEQTEKDGAGDDGEWG